MKQPEPLRYYELLPAVIRWRDEQEGYPLRDLLRVLSSEADVIEADIARLYRNAFIETCDEWAVPYLADLLGYRLAADRRVGPGHHPRREVAKALSYRRRSGTASLQAELAFDLAGWPARVLEYGEQICTTTAACHPRAAAVFTNVRDRTSLRRLNGPFDTTPRLPAVRPVRGRHYHRLSLGLFVWRTVVRRIELADALREGEDNTRYAADPLGADTTFYLRPDLALTAVGTGGATSTGFPNPIAAHHLRVPRPDGGFGASDEVYGPGASFEIFVKRRADDETFEPIPAELIEHDDSSRPGWGPSAPERVAVDPRRGRIKFDQPVDAVRVTYLETAPPGLGAGRSAEVPRPGRQAENASDRSAAARSFGREDGAAKQLIAELQHVAAAPNAAVVEIIDSATYAFAGKNVIQTTVDTGRRLEVRAAPGARPTIRFTSNADNSWHIVVQADAHLVLEGLLLCGPIVLGGRGSVTLRDCTVRPPPNNPLNGLIVDAGLSQLRIERCLIDAIHYTGAATTTAGLTISDSVAGRIEGTNDAAVRLDIRRCTVFGDTEVRHLELAENTIFAGPLRVEHRQAGGVRHCYLPAASITPRRYRCLTEATGIAPRFMAVRSGAPGYAVLADDCPVSITVGADDGGELGATHDAFEFRRLNDLRERLADYVPAGFGLQVVPVSPGGSLELRS